MVPQAVTHNSLSHYKTDLEIESCNLIVVVLLSILDIESLNINVNIKWDPLAEAHNSCFHILPNNLRDRIDA
jgi:hypothetical protein